MSISYVLPIKWDGDQPLGEITDYLRTISPFTELIIVDGSADNNFQIHHAAWSGLGKHIAPHSHFQFLNGKVNGVLTGLEEAKHPHVIIADDDVRYSLKQILEMDRLLAVNHLIIPQNYFNPCPWHAQWDTSRSLLNLAFAHDYPGTLAVQRDFLTELGGYDGDVLFENLELIRTIKAGNGKILYKSNFLVERLPPSADHFWSQRVRQAYDDYAQPARWLFFLLLIPVSVLLASYAIRLIAVEIALAILVAEIGRRRFRGTRAFSLSCSFFAPVWLLERGICTWLALVQKLMKGGVEYNHAIIKTAANPLWKIKERLKRNKATSVL